MTSSIPSNWALKLLLAAISGIFATFLVNAGHNFIHQRNSWRMYGCHAALINFREFRVLHAMSHHMYPNSVYDLETLIYEPFFKYLPIAKTKMRIFLNYLSIPLIYILGFHGAFLYRVIGLFQSDWKTDMQILYFDDIIGFLMPPLIFFTKIIYLTITESSEEFSFYNLFLIAFEAGFLGNFILMSASVTFSVIGLNVGHHGTDVTHEGDEFKSLDFGIYQLATTIDRTGANANLFMVLTHYGEHIIHHMIPSVDLAVLHLFWDILEETCKEFEAEIKLIPIKKAALLQFQQLKRIEYNKIEKDENDNVVIKIQE
ncbi:hypothetical protein PVAND_016738 [Polypedilum vanderplanki]|nr:hypothetical protein PVAND_016738 [Polypedilum vanderplanki]